MILIVVSKPDPASVNIQKRLFETSTWEEHEQFRFDDNPVYINHAKEVPLWMVTITRRHLDHDNLDIALRTQLNLEPDTIIYASRHRTSSGINTLTVHPIGNFGEIAEYGGKPRELVPASPWLMTAAYRTLYSKVKSQQLQPDGKKFGYKVSFEATHHGPYLETPTFFIEIGSDERAWDDLKAAGLIAETIMAIVQEWKRTNEYPVAIGVGGGHYAPRISDVARTKQIAFGHIIPSYAIEGGDSEIIPESLLLKAIEKTPEVRLVYLHRRALKVPVYRKLKTWFKDQGLEIVGSSDLDDIDS